MKGLLSSIALTAAGFIFSFSANAQTDSKNVNLSVVLANAVSITFASGSDGQDATLNYTTPADYQNGVSITQATAFTASSTQAYTVKVKASGDLVYSGAAAANTGDIPVVNVKVNANASGTSGVTFASAVGLTTDDQTIITSEAGTTSQIYSLTYSTVDAPASDFLNKAAGTYSTTLTYTITAP